MIAKGDSLSKLRCFVPGSTVTHLGDVAPGEYLVVYIGGVGVRAEDMDNAVKWPLPTKPRTTFAVVDHECAYQGFIRVLMIEDVALEINRAAAPPTNIIRAMVLDPRRVVIEIIDELDPVVLRSKVSLALAGPNTTYEPALAHLADDPTTDTLFTVLAGRAEMLLSPLVNRVERLGRAERPILELLLVLHTEEQRGEAIERLIGAGYDYLGNQGSPGRDLVCGPEDEPRHVLHVVVKETEESMMSNEPCQLPAAPKWRGINHLALITPDMDATVRFYTGVLGMPLVATLMAGTMRHYFFGMGNSNTVAFFEVIGAQTFSKAAGAPTDRVIQLDHLSFDVADEDALEVLRRRVLAAGCEITGVVDHTVFRSVYFTDPNGIALEASYWRIDTTTEPAFDDPMAFTDPHPVPAVAELHAGGLTQLVHTRLI